MIQKKFPSYWRTAHPNLERQDPRHPKNQNPDWNL